MEKYIKVIVKDNEEFNKVIANIENMGVEVANTEDFANNVFFDEEAMFRIQLLIEDYHIDDVKIQDFLIRKYKDILKEEYFESEYTIDNEIIGDITNEILNEQMAEEITQIDFARKKDLYKFSKEVANDIAFSTKNNSLIFNEPVRKKELEKYLKNIKDYSLISIF